MSYSYVIVEDNELDRLSLKVFLKSYPDFITIGEYTTAEEALVPIKEKKPHVIFLDIDMGEMSGIALRSQLPEIPVCIFITSHPEYAIDGFEQNALDFLTKPLQKERFEQSILRARQYLQIKEKATILDDNIGTGSIFIKNGHEKIKINTHEILFLEALKDYTKIVTSNKSHFVLSSLSALLLENAFSSFIRIHRSFAVPKHYIKKLKANEVTIDQHTIPIGRSYKMQLQNL
ncbi:MAG: LytTR family DNA-binding domain-containing protein [Chitinophagales bacterium]